MLTRSTALATLAGVFVALLITGGFLALDRTTLYWYAEEDAPAGLTATEAEAYVISYITHGAGGAVGLWEVPGWLPDCEARDRSQAGWLVRCGMTHPTRGLDLPQNLTYLVGDDGIVASFP